MMSKLGGEPRAKRVCSSKEAVEYQLETDDELSDLTENDFSYSGSDIIEPKSDKSVVLSAVKTDFELLSQHLQEDI